MTFLNYKLEFHVWPVCVRGYTDIYMKFMFFDTQKQERPAPPSTQQMLQVLSPEQNTQTLSTRRDKHHRFCPHGQL